jgi:hemerythrin-like metal-binding protein
VEKHDWTGDLELGVEALDAEHRLLIDLVNDLASALGTAEDRERVGATIRRLHDLTSIHFRAEDLLMRLHAYDGQEVHAAEHARLAGHLSELREAHSRGDLPATPDLAAALRKWLGGHIQTQDRALADFLRSVGVV